MKHVTAFLILMLFFATTVFAQIQSANYITFGKQAPTEWGDDDFNHLFFIAVSLDSMPFYLWLYDADCGGELDELNEGWNTQTKFCFYGGEEAFSNPDAKTENPVTGITSGTLLKEEIFGKDPTLDQKWKVWGPFDPSQGEIVGNESIFKLSVTGESGDDGNIYNLFFSKSETQRVPIDDARFFCYEVTFQMPAELKKMTQITLLPEKPVTKIMIHNFDADSHGGFTLNTPQRKGLPIEISGNDNWAETAYTMGNDEQVGDWSVNVGKSDPENNDVVYYFEYEDKNLIPIELPLIITDFTPTNSTPEVLEVITESKDCNTVIFDASGSSDANLDELTYSWDLGDGTQVAGIRVEHLYEKSGDYPVTLTVTDNSGSICAISHSMVKININTPPTADAGRALKGCPNSTIIFDGSRSHDPDGSIVEYTWNFGDGSTKKGVNPTHVYTEPGNYTAKLVIKDDSGTTCDSASDQVDVFINTPPIANAGPDQTVGTTTVVFDGTQSYDPDSENDFVGGSLLYTWDFGDGSAPKQGATPFHTFAEPGRYTVTLTVKDRSGTSCDIDTDVMIVTINKAPEANAGEDRITCVNKVVNLNAGNSLDIDGSIERYAWDFGDGTVGEGIQTSHSYTNPGTYTVTLSVQDNAGTLNSRDVDVLTVKVNELPIARAGKDVITCTANPILFDANKSYDPDGNITAYMWDFGDGSTGTGVRPTHAYAQTGEYTVILTVVDDSNTECASAVDELTVTINEPPIAVAGEDRVVCCGTIAFDGTASSDPDGEIVQYLWDFGDGTRGSGATPKHVYEQEGIYTITLTVKDNSGTNCNSNSDVMVLTANNSPIADAGTDKRACPGDIINFDGSGSSDPDGSIKNYQWDFGDNTPLGTGPKVTHTYQNPGNYIATLTITDDSNTKCAKSVDEITVKINAAPIAVAGNDRKACIDEPIQFNGGSSYDTDGEIKKYVWDFGDGSPTVETIAPNHVYTNPGTYVVTLTVWDNSPTACNMATDELTVFINEIPIADASENIMTCNNTITFNGRNSADPDGGTLSYEWDFGDGTPLQGGVSPTHTFAKPGTYPVVLTVRDNSGTACNSHTDDITVIINQPPVADAGESQVVCLSDMVTFNGSKSYDPEGGFLEFHWDFGDGTVKEGVMNPVHRYEKGGIYNVVLMVKDDSNTPCNTGKDIVTIQVAESPTAEAGEEKIVCAHTEVSFDGTESKDIDGQVNAFYWDFGDGSQSSGPVVTHSYSHAGEYNVTLTIVGDEIGNCDNTDTDFVKVLVHEAPTAEAGDDVKSCPQANIKFDASGSVSSAQITEYLWDFGDGITSNLASPSHTYTNPGIYQVKLKIKDSSQTSCNESEDTKLVTINSIPVAEAGENVKGCINDILSFDASQSSDADGSIISYIWDFGDGDQAQGVTATHSYAEPGTYDVSLTITDNSNTDCNVATDAKTVTINKPPIADAGSRQVTCVDELVQFDGSLSEDFDGSVVSYSWNFGDGIEGTGKNPTHRYKNPGTYQASLIIKDDSDLPCNTGSSAVTVVVNEVPIAEAGTDMITCPGQVVTFDGSNSIDNDGEIIRYDWDFGDGTVGEWKKPTHKYEEPGVYEVTLTVTDNSGSNCPTATDKVKVVVNHPPVADAGPDEMIACIGCAQDAVNFDASESYDPEGGALTFRWDFGDGEQGTGIRTVHSYAEPGVYTVTLIVNDDSGTICNSSTDMIIVRANKAPDPSIDVFKQGKDD